MFSVLGFLPTATSSSEPVAVEPSSIVTVTSPSRATETARQLVRTSTPASRSAASTSAEANGSSRTITRGAPSSTTTLVPSDAHACPSSTPTTPPPRTTRLSGGSVAVVASRFPHGRASARPGIGGTTGPLPVATMTAVRASSVSSPTRIRLSPSKPAVPADQHDAALLQPGQLGGVVEPVNDLVAPRQHRGGVETVHAQPRHTAGLGEQLARPQQRLRGHARVVGALAADQVLLDDRDLEPGRAEPAGSDLAGRAGADHDDVEAPLGHASSLADRRCATIAA